MDSWLGQFGSRRRSRPKQPYSDQPRFRCTSWGRGGLPPRSGGPRVGSIKQAHGHGLRGISRGTSAAPLHLCPWKSWFRLSRIL
jgi:hypothetical protein